LRRIFLLLLIFTLVLGTLAIRPAVALQTCNALPFSSESEFVLYERPVLRVNPDDAPTDARVIIRDGYEFRNNGTTKLADWAAYIVEPSHIGSAGTSNFGNDLCLSPNHTFEADPSSEDDYASMSSLGLERVHLVDPQAFGNTSTRFDLDLYSNIVPMHEDVIDAWKGFDKAIRDYVLRENQPAYVLTGTEYMLETPSLPGADEPHAIPSGYWKFVYITGTGERDPETNALDALISWEGMWVNQADCLADDSALNRSCQEEHDDGWQNRYIRPVDIEARTRFDFFTGLPNDVEYPMEQARNCSCYLNLEPPED